jgi:DNA-binding GntR family transcriptional regulator
VAALGVGDLEELYQVREALEGMAARFAAERMTDDEITGLHDLLDRHEQQEDLRENTAYFQREGDLDFHYRVIQGSHNRVLSGLLVGELYHLARMYRYQFSAVGNRPRKALEEHRRIVEAIGARDGELAELLMRRHISRAWENIRAQIGAGRTSPQIVADRNTA